MRKWEKQAVDRRTPDLGLLRKERRMEILAALRRLSRLDRAVIEARYLDGMTYREVAEAVGMSRDGVRLRVASAVRRLGKVFGPQGNALDLP